MYEMSQAENAIINYRTSLQAYEEIAEVGNIDSGIEPMEGVEACSIEFEPESDPESVYEVRIEATFGDQRSSVMNDEALAFITRNGFIIPGLSEKIPVFGGEFSDYHDPYDYLDLLDESLREVMGASDEELKSVFPAVVQTEHELQKYEEDALHWESVMAELMNDLEAKGYQVRYDEENEPILSVKNHDTDDVAVVSKAGDGTLKVEPFDEKSEEEARKSRERRERDDRETKSRGN